MNNNSLFPSDATVDIDMPSPCTYGVFPRNISVKAFSCYTWGNKTRSDHVTRNALAARDNEAYGQVTADSRSV